MRRFALPAPRARYVALRRGTVGAVARTAEGTSRRTWLMLSVPPLALGTLVLLVASLRASTRVEEHRMSHDCRICIACARVLSTVAMPTTSSNPR